MMNRIFNNRGIVSVAGMIVVLGLARAADALLAFLRARNTETFAFSYIILWSYPLLTLVLALGLLLLFWFVVDRAPRNIWVALIFILTGFFVVSYPALYLTPALCCWFPQFAAWTLSPTLYIYSTGGFIAMIGLLILILPRGQKTDL